LIIDPIATNFSVGNRGSYCQYLSDIEKSKKSAELIAHILFSYGLIKTMEFPLVTVIAEVVYLMRNALVRRCS